MHGIIYFNNFTSTNALSNRSLYSNTIGTLHRPATFGTAGRGTWLGATHPVPDHPARTSVPTSYYLLYMAQIHKATEQVFDGDILTKYRQRCYQALRLQEKDKEGLGLVNWWSSSHSQWRSVGLKDFSWKQHWVTVKNRLLILMHSGDNWIYVLHVIIQNGLFADCKVLYSFWGLCGPRTGTCGPSTRT